MTENKPALQRIRTISFHAEVVNYFLVLRIMHINNKRGWLGGSVGSNPSCFDFGMIRTSYHIGQKTHPANKTVGSVPALL